MQVDIHSQLKQEFFDIVIICPVRLENIISFKKNAFDDEIVFS